MRECRERDLPVSSGLMRVGPDRQAISKRGHSFAKASSREGFRLSLLSIKTIGVARKIDTVNQLINLSQLKSCAQPSKQVESSQPIHRFTKTMLWAHRPSTITICWKPWPACLDTPQSLRSCPVPVTLGPTWHRGGV